MPEESATHDLVELTRQVIDAGNWLSSYEVFNIAPDEVLDMGGGIAFVVGRQGGRLLGAAGHVEQRAAWAMTWKHGLAVHIIAGMDIDEARAVAERLAEERGRRCLRT